jgi:hypothetical protein
MSPKLVAAAPITDSLNRIVATIQQPDYRDITENNRRHGTSRDTGHQSIAPRITAHDAINPLLNLDMGFNHCGMIAAVANRGYRRA